MLWSCDSVAFAVDGHCKPQFDSLADASSTNGDHHPSRLEEQFRCRIDFGMFVEITGNRVVV